MSFVWVKNGGGIMSVLNQRGNSVICRNKLERESQRSRRNWWGGTRPWDLPCQRSREFVTRFSAPKDFPGLPGSAGGCKWKAVQWWEDFWSVDLGLDLQSMVHDMIPSSTSRHLSLMWRVICLLLLGIKIVCHRILVLKNSLKVNCSHFPH